MACAGTQGSMCPCQCIRKLLKAARRRCVGMEIGLRMGMDRGKPKSGIKQKIMPKVGFVDQGQPRPAGPASKAPHPCKKSTAMSRVLYRAVWCASRYARRGGKNAKHTCSSGSTSPGSVVLGHRHHVVVATLWLSSAARLPLPWSSFTRRLRHLTVPHSKSATSETPSAAMERMKAPLLCFLSPAALVHDPHCEVSGPEARGASVFCAAGQVQVPV